MNNNLPRTPENNPSPINNIPNIPNRNIPRLDQQIVGDLIRLAGLPQNLNQRREGNNRPNLRPRNNRRNNDPFRTPENAPSPTFNIPNLNRNIRISELPTGNDLERLSLPQNANQRREGNNNRPNLRPRNNPNNENRRNVQPRFY